MSDRDAGTRVATIPSAAARREMAEQHGGCPVCHEMTGYLNVYKDHWARCMRHKTKWLLGTGMF